MLDEVAFGLELGGMDRAEALRRAQLVIDRFGLPADEEMCIRDSPITVQSFRPSR